MSYQETGLERSPDVRYRPNSKENRPKKKVKNGKKKVKKWLKKCYSFHDSGYEFTNNFTFYGWTDGRIDGWH